MKTFLIGFAFLAGLIVLDRSPDSSACSRRACRVPLMVAAEYSPVAFAAADPAPADKEKPDPEREAVLKNVQTFVDAFNKKDAAAASALFTEDCDVSEYDGDILHGRKEVEDDLKDTFTNEPQAKISVDVDSLKAIAPGVMLEEGKTVYYPDGKTATAETRYEAIHVKNGDRWLMSKVKSYGRTVLTPYEHLRQLDWLVGDWVDESSDSVVESTYRWVENRAFLLQDFTIRVKGRSVLKGTQRIGWDPLAKQVRAWVFDSEGGYAESFWTNVDGTWVIRAKGTRSDGTVVTMTNQLTQVAKDRMRFESIDRIIGDERQPALVAFIVRRPPAPKN